MTPIPSTHTGWAARQRKNTTWLALWTGAWVVSMALSTFGPLFLWTDHLPLTLGAIALNVAVGAGMILANKRHLQGLDELQQRIQLEAMGLTLGAGLVLGLAYANLDSAEVIAGHAEISYLVMLMGLTYLAASLVGTWRYR